MQSYYYPMVAENTPKERYLYQLDLSKRKSMVSCRIFYIPAANKKKDPFSICCFIPSDIHSVIAFLKFESRTLRWTPVSLTFSATKQKLSRTGRTNSNSHNQIRRVKPFQDFNRIETKEKEINTEKYRIETKEAWNRGEITGIAAADHEDPTWSRDVLANKRTKRRIPLIPVEGTALLNVARVPVERVAVVVGVAGGHVPEHVLLGLVRWVLSGFRSVYTAAAGGEGVENGDRNDVEAIFWLVRVRLY